MWPEEFNSFRPEELKALGINRLDLLGFSASELEGLQSLSELGVPDVLGVIENQVGDIFAAASASAVGWISKLAGGALGFLVPGLGFVASGLASAALSSILSGIFQAFQGWPPDVSDEGMKYKRILFYMPVMNPQIIPAGVHKTELPDGMLLARFNEPNNYIVSKASPYMPVCHYYGKNKDGSPRMIPIVGLTREGYALSSLYKGSSAFIGVSVDPDNDKARAAGASEALIVSTAKVALIAHAIGMPGGFWGVPGWAGVAGRIGRRFMATFEAVKGGVVGTRDVIFGASFWRFIPGFRPVRSSGGRRDSVYAFRFEFLKEDIGGWFYQGGGFGRRGEPETPGRVKWVSLAIVAGILGVIGFLFSRRKK
jgi:hypothetical protein